MLLSNLLATSAFQRPDITPLIQVASLIILTGAFLNSAQAAFIGFEKMQFSSTMLIVQSIIRATVIPSLVILGYGAFGAVLGYTLALLISGLTGILLMWILYKNLPKQASNNIGISASIKKMFKYGLPLSISTIVDGFLLQFYNFLLALYATDVMYGNYTIAINFAVVEKFPGKQHEPCSAPNFFR